MAPPSLIVTFKLPRGKDGEASSQTEDAVASKNGEGQTVALTAETEGTSNQSHDIATSAGAHIKQEPTFGTAAIPSAPTTSMANTCGTRSTASTATKGASPAEPHQPTTNIKANSRMAKKGPNSAKRKAESSGNEGLPTKKKPTEYPRPNKPATAAKEYMAQNNSIAFSGKNVKHPHDTDLKLPLISQAPAVVHGHLRGLMSAGLKLSHADQETIKTQVKVLGGLCHAFKDLKPWLVERDGEPRVDDFKWCVQALNHPLHSHQMLGSAIMIVIERDESQGSGLLLDFMGYGKTVQMLACVVSNPARPKRGQKKGQRPKDGSATTLVVVPKSAATQWVEEVKRHTNPELSVMLWTKQTEITRDATLAVHILVVTYDSVRAMHKACKTSNTTSLLFDACYQRIVLDEGHRIKNRDSEIFKACMDLDGKHKWVLTGTPIPNGVHELWPLLKFIRHPSVKDSGFAHFKQNYLTKGRGTKLKGVMQYEDLSELLLPISIMRTPGHQFCGIPLVNLPQDHAVQEKVALGAEEKIILAYLEMYIVGYIKTKCGGKTNYICLKERFLRYRQFSASPLLLEGPVKYGLWTLDQVGLMKEEAHHAGAEVTPIIDVFERWILEPKRDHLAPTGDRKVDSALAKADTMICPLCSQRQVNPLLADCGHIWCEECVKKWQKELKQNFCNKCKQPIGEVRPYNPEEASDHEEDAMRSHKGFDHNGFQPADDEGSTLFQYLDQHPGASIPLSAKMKHALQLILKWQAEAPNDKIIFFFYFIGVSRLLARLLQENGIGCLYFVGKMNGQQRRDARVAFEENEAIKVLMVSINTGGEALNLTMANRCIIYDPWWNNGVEEQAFGRVNRIGQVKETQCVRLLADGTIDDRMNYLQNKKKKQQSAIAELEAGKGLTAKTLHQILDGQIKEGGSDDRDADTDSEDSGEDDEDDYSESEPEDPDDGDWMS